MKDKSFQIYRTPEEGKRGMGHNVWLKECGAGVADFEDAKEGERSRN